MAVKKRIAVYPGSFDPLTLGHLDIIARSVPYFDRIIIGIGANDSKSGLFRVEEREAIINEACRGYSNVEASAFSGLTVDFARKVGANTIIRGLRNEIDYQYEFQMAMTNRLLGKGIETLFLPTQQHLCHISSKLVKEIARLGGDVSSFVPPSVLIQLKNKFQEILR